MSREARIEAGTLLRLLQEGETLGMPRSRPMPTIGPGCHELRGRDARHTWRIVYRIDPDAILLVHCFDKDTRATPRRDIDLCRARLRAYDEDARG